MQEDLYSDGFILMSFSYLLQITLNFHLVKKKAKVLFFSSSI